MINNNSKMSKDKLRNKVAGWQMKKLSKLENGELQRSYKFRTPDIAPKNEL